MLLVDNSWMVEVSSLDLLLNINHDKVRARVIELLLLFLTKTKNGDIFVYHDLVCRGCSLGS